MIRRLLRYLALVPFRKVTVYLINGELVRGRVHDSMHDAVAFRVSRFQDGCAAGGVEPCKHNYGLCVRSRADEGISWCRGWAGPAVDALKTVLALREASAVPTRRAR